MQVWQIDHASANPARQLGAILQLSDDFLGPCRIVITRSLRSVDHRNLSRMNCSLGREAERGVKSCFCLQSEGIVQSGVNRIDCVDTARMTCKQGRIASSQ